MPGRSYTGSGYRYGFNGQEKDDEVSGSGNVMTAEFWEYDTRLGKRWNIDPIVKPYLSGYSTFGGNPIVYNDPNGDSWDVKKEEKDGKTTYNITINAALYNKSGSKELDMTALQDKIKSQVEAVYNTNNVDGGKIEVNTTMNIRTVNSLDEVKDDDHLITVLNDKEFSDLGLDAKGASDLGGLKIVIPEKTALATIDGSNDRTVAHEFGHTGGLYHPYDFSAWTVQGVNKMSKTASQNLMYPTTQSSSRALNPTQIEVISSNFIGGRLNQQTQFTHKTQLVYPGAFGRPMLGPRQVRTGINMSFQNWVGWSDWLFGP